MGAFCGFGVIDSSSFKIDFGFTGDILSWFFLDSFLFSGQSNNTSGYLEGGKEMGILGGNPQQEPLHCGEVFDIYNALSVAQAGVSFLPDIC